MNYSVYMNKNEERMGKLWHIDMGNAIKLKRKVMQQKCSWEERVYVD